MTQEEDKQEEDKHEEDYSAVDSGYTISVYSDNENDQPEDKEENKEEAEEKAIFDREMQELKEGVKALMKRIDEAEKRLEEEELMIEQQRAKRRRHDLWFNEKYFRRLLYDLPNYD